MEQDHEQHAWKTGKIAAKITSITIEIDTLAHHHYDWGINKQSYDLKVPVYHKGWYLVPAHLLQYFDLFEN